MDQELAEKVLASRHMPHGSRSLASVPESELQHPRVDLGMLRISLESPLLRHVSAGRGLKESYSESGSGLVLVHDIKSGSLQAGDHPTRTKIWCIVGHTIGWARPGLYHQVPRPAAPRC